MPLERRPYDFQRDDQYSYLLGMTLGPGSRPIPTRPRSLRPGHGARVRPRYAHLLARSRSV
jgi:hypothetical protein